MASKEGSYQMILSPIEVRDRLSRLLESTQTSWPTTTTSQPETLPDHYLVSATSKDNMISRMQAYHLRKKLDREDES